VAATMKKANNPKQASPKQIKVEPGAEKRLANILKKALNTPRAHVPPKRMKHKRK
jgi:hypothetical protein